MDGLLSIAPLLWLSSATFHWCAYIKTAAGSPKGRDLTYPSFKVPGHALYTWMDFFQSHQLPKPFAILPSSHSRTFSCTSKTGWVGWFTKGLKLIYATLIKLLLQVAHAFLYTWMDFFQSSNV
jgi:hypothetical protein